jgi:hypothetical protein
MAVGRDAGNVKLTRRLANGHPNECTTIAGLGFYVTEGEP